MELATDTPASLWLVKTLEVASVNGPPSRFCNEVRSQAAMTTRATIDLCILGEHASLGKESRGPKAGRCLALVGGQTHKYIAAELTVPTQLCHGSPGSKLTRSV